eukprot:1145017-Pelagomonas_calceolata.AAC.1
MKSAVLVSIYPFIHTHCLQLVLSIAVRFARRGDVGFDGIKADSTHTFGFGGIGADSTHTFGFGGIGADSTHTFGFDRIGADSTHTRAITQMCFGFLWSHASFGTAAVFWLAVERLS